MKIILVLVLLIAGCAPLEKVSAPRPVQNTTVYRYATKACEPEKAKAAKTDDAELRQMTRSRDEWKRYAESLEKLLPSDIQHETHP